MKEYNFDKIVHRENTSSIKYDLRKKLFGREDIMPLWVADMDFETPDFIREAVIERAKHPVYGYTFRDEAFYHSIMNWMEKRHDWPISQNWISFSPGIVPALNMAVMTYSEPGDGIIVQPPVYFPFFTAVGNHNRNILNIFNIFYNHFFNDFDYYDHHNYNYCA